MSMAYPSMDVWIYVYGLLAFRYTDLVRAFVGLIMLSFRFSKETFMLGSILPR